MMKDMFKQLLNTGCITKKEYENKMNQVEKQRQDRMELIEILEKKNLENKDLYQEIYQEEVELLNMIKQMICQPEIKRLYQSKQYGKKVKKVLEPLGQEELPCVGERTKKELQEIYEELIQLAIKQRELDEKRLIRVKKQVGTKVWKEFGKCFEEDGFLDFMNQ
jgi:hypothetical protein